MSQTALLQSLRYKSIAKGGLHLSLYDATGNIAPEIHVVYENNRILVHYNLGYFLLDIHGDILEQNTHAALENSENNDLKYVNHEIVKALHTLTYTMTKQYTDCKNATVQMIIHGLKNAYPNEDVSTEVNLLTYLSRFHEQLNFLGGDVNPYDIKLQTANI